MVSTSVSLWVFGGSLFMCHGMCSMSVSGRPSPRRPMQPPRRRLPSRTAGSPQTRGRRRRRKRRRRAPRMPRPRPRVLRRTRKFRSPRMIRSPRAAEAGARAVARPARSQSLFEADRILFVFDSLRPALIDGAIGDRIVVVRCACVVWCEEKGWCEAERKFA